MINKIMKISFGGLILMAGLISCSVEGPSDVMPEPADKVSPIGPDVVAGTPCALRPKRERDP